MKELLEGVIDMHIHSGPAVIHRLHSMDVARELKAAGYDGFVIKDHHFPTTALAQMVNEAIGEGFTAYGSIVLNSSVGGINLNAVDAACKTGARIVYLPTISSPRHLEIQGDMFADSSSVPERPVSVVQDGKITSDVEDVLAYMARHKNVVLATGHSHADDLDLVIHRAVELGIERIFVNHPAHTIGASWEQMESWSRLDGVYLEINAVDMIGMSNMGRFPMSLVQEFLRRIPVEKTVMTSDFGQPKNGSPVEGLLRFMEAVHELGKTEEEIVAMIRDNPRFLLR